MATKTVTMLVDDLDGSVADRTVEIELDGVRYELDLSTAHQHEMMRDLARWTAVARRTGGDAAATPRFTETAVDPRAVREWARSNGIDVPAGRRVPREVVEQFRAAGY